MPVVEVAELRLGVYWDASWATRPSGELQGGHLVVASEDQRIDDGRRTPLVVINWASKKLMRVSRSSLRSEAQSAANAVDALEWCKTMMALILRPYVGPLTEEATKLLGRSSCVTDCKALFGAAKSVSSGRGL